MKQLPSLISILAVLLIIAGYALYRVAPDYDVRQPVLEAEVDAEATARQYPEWRACSERPGDTAYAVYYGCPEGLSQSLGLDNIKPRRFWHGGHCGVFAIQGYRIHHLSNESFHSVYCTFHLEKADPAKLYIYTCDADYMGSMPSWPARLMQDETGKSRFVEGIKN